ncbi:MAG: hypothetical protein ACKVJU_13560 [Verrucomicrobiales bacterium]
MFDEPTLLLRETRLILNIEQGISNFEIPGASEISDFDIAKALAMKQRALHQIASLLRKP